jgi:hypothetical protein
MLETLGSQFAVAAAEPAAVVFRLVDQFFTPRAQALGRLVQVPEALSRAVSSRCRSSSGDRLSLAVSSRSPSSALPVPPAA